MIFVDKCKVLIKAGNGGDGIVSWRREAHVPEGGPAGGNGGNGGNIYFVGDVNETSLNFLHNCKKVVAKNGENGGIKNMYGRNAEDVYVKVPFGTVVTNLSNNEIIADITVHNKEYLIAIGGKGGYGNNHFKSQKNKAPTLYEKGERGESFTAFLELKQISDVGLIGFPNAGKSSLISALTNAKPKIANYQFTTLNPNLGVINSKDNQKIVLADIPGLIEGASHGIGLGHEFLRHIERCKVLCHVVSLSNDDNEDIIQSIETIFNELNNYNNELLTKKMVLIANKSDSITANENLAKIRNTYGKKYEILVTSCLDNTGISELKQFLIDNFTSDKIAQLDEMKTWTFNPKLISQETKLNKNVFITKEGDHYFNVKCEYLEYWVYRIPINTPDNLIRLNQKIESVGVMQKLKELNAEIGDTINVYGVRLEYDE